ncbi:hypothetical protein LX83_005279 [Goodfellowiella coeruleoviolacea]|uniref:Uncharacterized protein n=1 Tax=Goodfellowiella coeruleoviolacea TaxID=334858 RepID=A0AAE3GHP7_9PSEU|nr:hypothetical protein [Goodfellowiella coeruleoviolacea]
MPLSSHLCSLRHLPVESVSASTVNASHLSGYAYGNAACEILPR